MGKENKISKKHNYRQGAIPVEDPRCTQGIETKTKTHLITAGGATCYRGCSGGGGTGGQEMD